VFRSHFPALLYQGLGLGLVSNWKPKVSVSDLDVSFTSLDDVDESHD